MRRRLATQQLLRSGYTFVEGAVSPPTWKKPRAGMNAPPARPRAGTIPVRSMLEEGQGVRKDLAAAHKLYVAAANKGNAKAIQSRGDLRGRC